MSVQELQQGVEAAWKHAYSFPFHRPAHLGIRPRRGR